MMSIKSRTIWTDRKGPITVFILGLVIFLAAVLRIYKLASESYWIDEIATIYNAQESPGRLLTKLTFESPPVYFVLMHYWIKFAGTNEFATRMFSAFVGIISVLLIYLIGNTLFGRRIGLISSLMMAISEFQIYYSQEARYYSLFGLMALLSYLFFIRLLRKQKTTDAIFYALSNIFLFYTHAFGVFIIAAQGVYFLLRWARFRKIKMGWIASQVCIGLCILPEFWFTLFRNNQAMNSSMGKVSWIPTPSFGTLLRTLYEYVLPLRHGRNWQTVMINFVAAIIFLAVAISLYNITKRKIRWPGDFVSFGKRRTRLSEKKDPLILTFCWFALPIGLPFLLSKLMTPMYLDRYTISACPAFYILLAYGISIIRNLIPEIVIVVALVIIVGPGLQNYYRTDVNEQWQEVASYVNQNSRPADVVVFAPDQDGWQKRCFNWYYRGSLTECGIRSDIKDHKLIADVLEKCTSGYSRIWLVMRGPIDTIQRFLKTSLKYFQPRMRFIQEMKFTGINLLLYENK